jgi:hypothetical protein
MSTAKFIEVHVGDVVRLRKPHACGGTDWTIVRLGADIGLRCDRCQHRILLARSVFERRLKTFLSRAVTPVVDQPGSSLDTSVEGTNG